MKIQAKTEEQVAFKLLPDGQYPFTVLNSDEIKSKSEKNFGKMMFAVELRVHGAKFDVTVLDYFSDWFSEFKTRHFAACTGLLANYESGNLDGSKSAFKDRQGWVKIGHEDAKGNFPAKNVVRDYVVKEKASITSVKPVDDSDSIPF